MCLHRSYIVTEDLQVFSLPNNDHHTNIRAEYKIREEGLHHNIPHAAIEYCPVDSLFDLNRWKFFVDETSKPNWLNKEHQDKVFKKLQQDHMKYALTDSTYFFPGDLDLSDLREIKSNTTIIAEGCIEARSVTMIGDNVTLLSRGQGIKIGTPFLRLASPRVTLIGKEVYAEGELQRYANIVTERSNRERDQYYMRQQWNNKP